MDVVTEVLDELYDYQEAENAWSVEWDMTETNNQNYDKAELQHARLVEVERPQRFKVKVSFVEGDRLWKRLLELGWSGKVWDMRWVDQQRDGYIRSRCVGRQYNNSLVYGLFAATPDGVVVFILLDHLASDKRLMFMTFDVTAAYLHAPMKSIHVMRPPENLRRVPNELWLARKAMLGFRESGRLYQDFQSDEFVKEGFERGDCEPCAYRQRVRKLRMVVHGDDGGMVGRVADAEMDEVAAPFLEQFLPLAVQHYVRLARVALGHLHVVPAQLGTDAGAERLRDRLLGGETRGQAWGGVFVPQAVVDLGGEQDACLLYTSDAADE